MCVCVKFIHTLCYCLSVILLKSKFIWNLITNVYNLAVFIKSEFEIELDEEASSFVGFYIQQESDPSSLIEVNLLSTSASSSLKEVKASPELLVLENRKELPISSLQEQTSSTLNTHRPYRAKKLSSVLKNYHLGKFKRDREILKLNKITSELPLECSLQDETDTELNYKTVSETVQLVTSSVKLPKKKLTVPEEIRLKNTFHLPVKCKTRRCAYCSTKKEVRKTGIMCQTCNVPLCLKSADNCFELFHKVKER